MPLSVDVCGYLGTTTIGLGLTAGTNLFAVPFPEASQDQAVSLIETPGSQDEHAAGASLSAPLYETARFSIICRDAEANSATAQALARSIRLKLNRMADTTLGTTLVMTMKSLSRPFYISTDSNQRHRWVTTYETEMRDLGST